MFGCGRCNHVAFTYDELLLVPDSSVLMLEVWNPASSEDEVLVMVCRTGLNTTMGSIIRELLVPTKAAKQDLVLKV